MSKTIIKKEVSEYGTITLKFCGRDGRCDEGGDEDVRTMQDLYQMQGLPLNLKIRMTKEYREQRTVRSLHGLTLR